MKPSEILVCIFLFMLACVTATGWYMLSNKIITVKKEVHQLQDELREIQKLNYRLYVENRNLRVAVKK